MGFSFGGTKNYYTALLPFASIKWKGRKTLMEHIFPAFFIFKWWHGWWQSSWQHLQKKMANSGVFFISDTMRAVVWSLSLVLLRHRGFIPLATWNSHKNNNSIASHSIRSIGRLKKTYLISLKLLVWNWSVNLDGNHTRGSIPARSNGFCKFSKTKVM